MIQVKTITDVTAELISKAEAKLWLKVGIVVNNGTATGEATGKLIQTLQNFETTVTVGDDVKNTTDNTLAVVTTIDSDTQLAISKDIMETGEDYDIISGYTADDDLITALIVGARVAAEQYCNRTFCTKTLEVWTDEIGRDTQLELPYPPHQSIEEVMSLDVEESETELILNKGYFKKGLTDFILTIQSAGQIKVQYKAGYLTSGAFQCPVEIVNCMKTIIANNFEFREDFIEGGIALISQDVKTRLNPFRHLAI